MQCLAIFGKLYGKCLPILGKFYPGIDGPEFMQKLHRFNAVYDTKFTAHYKVL